MGFSLSWIAVHSDKHDAIFDALAISPTTQEDEFFEAKLSGSPLTDGWFLLAGQGCENYLVQQETLTKLSAIGPTIACSVEEHVMFSSAQYWRLGALEWYVSHDGQKGRYNLEMNGALPNSFEYLKTRTIENQDREGGEEAEVDLLFDLPLLLALDLTGFKHDQECDVLAQPNPVVFLEKGRTALSGKRPWWKLW